MTNTDKVVAAIGAEAAGKDLAPVSFTYQFGRSACSSGFRAAKQAGLIVVKCRSAAGTPIYTRTAVRAL
jgi:hypothetical protein